MNDMNQTFFSDIGATMPVDNPFCDVHISDIGATMPVSGSGADDLNATMPPVITNATMPPVVSDADKKAEKEDLATTVRDTAPLDRKSGFDPVVGWVACIEGAAKGNDYRLQEGYNYIGQSEDMEICVPGDHEIAHKRHAMIAYDSESNKFFFGPAEGRTIVRRNDKLVLTPVELESGDVLRIGNTKLMFVPLCSEKFSWKE